MFTNRLTDRHWVGLPAYDHTAGTDRDRVEGVLHEAGEHCGVELHYQQHSAGCSGRSCEMHTPLQTSHSHRVVQHREGVAARTHRLQGAQIKMDTTETTLCYFSVIINYSQMLPLNEPVISSSVVWLTRNEAVKETVLPGRWRIEPTLRELLMFVTSGAAQIDKRSNTGVKHTDNNIH